MALQSYLPSCYSDRRHMVGEEDQRQIIPGTRLDANGRTNEIVGNASILTRATVDEALSRDSNAGTAAIPTTLSIGIHGRSGVDTRTVHQSVLSTRWRR